MPLSVHALTTVSSVRSALVGRDVPPPEHDPELEALINATSEAIERYCGRHFEERTVTSRLSGNGRQWLLLPEYPVRSVAQVLVGGVQVTDYDMEPSSDYPGLYSGRLYREAGWPSGRPLMTFPPYPHPWAASHNIEVTYVAGWKLPASPARDLPYDIERACIDLVVAAYLNRDKLGLRGQTWEGGSLQLEWWPEHVRRVLDRYRRF